MSEGEVACSLPLQYNFREEVQNHGLKGAMTWLRPHMPPASRGSREPQVREGELKGSQDIKQDPAQEKQQRPKDTVLVTEQCHYSSYPTQNFNVWCLTVEPYRLYRSGYASLRCCPDELLNLKHLSPCFESRVCPHELVRVH